MSKKGVRPNRCPYCGRKCDGAACAQHRELHDPPFMHASDAETELDELALHLQNASRVNFDSPSNRALRKMMHRATVLDLLERAVSLARES